MPYNRNLKEVFIMKGKFKTIGKIVVYIIIRIVLYIPMIIYNFIYSMTIGVYKTTKCYINNLNGNEYIASPLGILIISIWNLAALYLSSLYYIIDYWVDSIRYWTSLSKYVGIRGWIAHILINQRWNLLYYEVESSKAFIEGVKSERES